VAPLEHGVHLEGHVAQRIASKRVAPLEHVVHPEGHVAWMLMKENLNDPKTLTPDKFLRMNPLIKMSPCSDQNLNLKKKKKNISQLNVTSHKKRFYKNKPRE
jgi:hypothetical protein